MITVVRALQPSVNRRQNCVEMGSRPCLLQHGKTVRSCSTGSPPICQLFPGLNRVRRHLRKITTVQQLKCRYTVTVFLSCSTITSLSLRQNERRACLLVSYRPSAIHAGLTMILPLQTLSRSDRSAVALYHLFQGQKGWRSPRHRSALRPLPLHSPPRRLFRAILAGALKPGTITAPKLS